jgi:alkylation response protein AidB-like acyl-CoA dehydrogenase
VQRYIFARERTAAGAPPFRQAGINLVGPVIMRYGTAEQKAHFLPRILSGEDYWCQGYSEPEAGSDLASLQMSAVEDGDFLVCNGTKLWTSWANLANWIFCLVRTSREARKQQGITFLLIDMKSPGVSVRPIVMLSGEHIQNQEFFDNVRVPKANVLGEIGDGWSVAKYLLEFERGFSFAPDLQVWLADLSAVAARQPGEDGGSLLDSPAFAAKLAAMKIRVDILEVLEFRLLSAASLSGSVGVSSSMMKTLGAELSQEITELILEAAGMQGMIFQPHATAPGGPIASELMHYRDDYVSGEPWQAVAPLRYLNDRVGSIFAGSNEIQRNILAKTVLGL